MGTPVFPKAPGSLRHCFTRSTPPNPYPSLREPEDPGHRSLCTALRDPSPPGSICILLANSPAWARRGTEPLAQLVLPGEPGGGADRSFWRVGVGRLPFLHWGQHLAQPKRPAEAGSWAWVPGTQQTTRTRRSGCGVAPVTPTGMSVHGEGAEGRHPANCEVRRTLAGGGSTFATLTCFCSLWGEGRPLLSPEPPADPDRSGPPALGALGASEAVLNGRTCKRLSLPPPLPFIRKS